ncbi:MAG TPA: glycosyltransferase [Rudaea sp.]|nr:glycosyltransferase [Rudaea sp.]
MRILHIGKFFPPHPGGIERFVADLTDAQVAQGMEVHVLAHAEPGTWRSRHFCHGAVEVTLAACHGQMLYAPVSPGFGWRLSRLIRQFKPDVLHLHLPNTSAFWALMLPSARRLPWVVHWHADIPLDSRRTGLRLAYHLYRPWEQAVLRRARSVIATSTPYLNSSLALAPWREKTRVIPLGIPPCDFDAVSAGLQDNETDWLANSPVETPSPPTASEKKVDVSEQRPSNAPTQVEAPSPHPALSRIASDGGEGKTHVSFAWPATGLKVLAVGRLSYFKGFDVLLRAMVQLPQASLLLIGDGECGVALRRLARNLDIAHRVNFAGRVDMNRRGAQALADAYGSADVFCLPSTERAESFGLVLLEAMRAGTPAIASDIPGSGVGYVVRNGETGLLVPPGDVAALVDALARMSADAMLRQRLGETGKQRWQREFTADRAAQRVRALYAEILQTTRPDTTTPEM